MVPGSFYSEDKKGNGPKILQEYRWYCKKCMLSSHLDPKWVVLEIIAEVSQPGWSCISSASFERPDMY
jgi:hypothetical protein